MYPTEATVLWSRVPSIDLATKQKVHSSRNDEYGILDIIDKFGVISGGQVQAHCIIGPSERKARTLLSRMSHQGKIISHKLTADNRVYKLYTLGPVGAKILGRPYNPDYWYFYKTGEAIQRVMALDLYLQMSKALGSEIEVTKGEPLYIFNFTAKEKVYKIGAIWDNLTAFIETYRWQPPEERVILICKELPAISSLLEYIGEHTPVRVTTCSDLRQGLVLYKPGKDGWEKA